MRSTASATRSSPALAGSAAEIRPEYEGYAGHISVETLTFTERDGKTTLTAISRFDTVEDRDQMLQSGMEEGANETWHRLAAYASSLR